MPNLQYLYIPTLIRSHTPDLKKRIMLGYAKFTQLKYRRTTILEFLFHIGIYLRSSLGHPTFYSGVSLGWVKGVPFDSLVGLFRSWYIEKSQFYAMLFILKRFSFSQRFLFGSPKKRDRLVLFSIRWYKVNVVYADLVNHCKLVNWTIMIEEYYSHG